MAKLLKHNPPFFPKLSSSSIFKWLWAKGQPLSFCNKFTKVKAAQKKTDAEHGIHESRKRQNQTKISNKAKNTLSILGITAIALNSAELDVRVAQPQHKKQNSSGVSKDRFLVKNKKKSFVAETSVALVQLKKRSTLDLVICSTH